ncbi:pol-like protein [Lasius niger]|uniref:Pol-like protein n=1 Tax=Lasius niger TaxID=67767 RepID=A0A0J7NLZ3_LASNI|nr:pol-like protein [Lasius niger]
MPDLHYLLNENKIGIAALCETRLNDNDYLSFTNYEIFTNNRNRHGGGVAILMDKRFRFSHVYDDRINTLCTNNEIEIIVGRIWLNSNNQIYVCSIYSPPRGSNHHYTDQHTWTEVLQFLNGLTPIIICGDINGKSALWSNQIQGPDNEGKKLETAISYTNFFCLNNGENTWMSADLSSTSALDITLISNIIAHKCNWEIMDSNYGSDHLPIITRINEISSNPDFGRPSFSTSTIDWCTFQEECISFTEAFHIVVGNLNATYEELISCIHRSLLIAGAIRHKPNNLRKNTPSPWWDEKCNEIIRDKSRIFREFKNQPSQANFKRYTESCKAASKFFAKKKKLAFRNFCSSIDINTPITRVWSYIRAFAKKRKGNSSNLIIAEKEFNEAFNKLAPQQVIDQPISDEDKQAIWNIPCNIKENDTSYLLTPFSSTEYGEVITTLKTKSAPGPDLISNKIIKKIPPATHSLILKIFNIFYNKGSYPEHWNEFYVVFIPKPGRKGALRLISLANNIHKIFEKLILKRLEWWAENSHILQKYQSGFRRGLSCTDTVSTLITDIHLANQGKN